MASVERPPSLLLVVPSRRPPGASVDGMTPPRGRGRSVREPKPTEETGLLLWDVPDREEGDEMEVDPAFASPRC